ncbi:MAG: hypothetical protein AB7O38_12615 [Pirellulaceae bacterium]
MAAKVTKLLATTLAGALLCGCDKPTSGEKPGDIPAGGKLVYEFRGTGEAETKEFVIRDDWGLDWEVRGNISRIGLRDLAEKAHPANPESNIVCEWDTNGRKSGFGTHHIGGRYRLKTFYAKGPWRIRVYQFPGRIE